MKLEDLKVGGGYKAKYSNYSKNGKFYKEDVVTVDYIGNVILVIITSSHEKDVIYIRQFLNAFEPVEEPKYYIHILKDRGDGYINKTKDDIIISNGNNIPKYQTHFTEEEINAIDPRFMAFAIPVEG